MKEELKSKLDCISINLSTPTKLEQLAEECTELAHAALKLARFYRGENPCGTDVNHFTLVHNLQSETIDVLICVDTIHDLHKMSMDFVEAGQEFKINRWYNRLIREEDISNG